MSQAFLETPLGREVHRQLQDAGYATAVTPQDDLAVGSPTRVHELASGRASAWRVVELLGYPPGLLDHVDRPATSRLARHPQEPLAEPAWLVRLRSWAEQRAAEWERIGKDESPGSSSRPTHFSRSGRLDVGPRNDVEAYDAGVAMARLVRGSL